MESTLFAFVLVYFFTKMYTSSVSGLELVNDDGLISLVSQHRNYVLALFTKEKCELCDKYEDALYSIREELEDFLGPGAYIVKVKNSQIVRFYNADAEPSLVFFRYGIPLLYHGEVDENSILHVISENKEPCVRELTDNSFEHLTQASTGATTGDWFIFFYSTDCVHCQNLQAKWEAVCVALKRKINVARVNTHVSKMIAQRFAIHNIPSFILFRHGKLYRYKVDEKYNVDAFVDFSKSNFKNARMEPVPSIKSPLEDFAQNSWVYLMEIPVIYKISFALVGFYVVVAIMCNSVMKKRIVKEKLREKQDK